MNQTPHTKPERNIRTLAKWSMLFALCPLLLLTGGAVPHPIADAVFLGGNVVTMHPGRSRVEAIAIAGRHIAAIGTTTQIRKWIGPRTRVISLRGKMVLPGLIEGHGHLMGLGLRTIQLDLVGTKTKQEILQKVRHATQHIPKGQWIIGRGWDQNDWPEKSFPTATELSKAAPDHPVYLRRIDGHAAWFNHRAMEKAGISDKTNDPPGGRLIRDSKGKPTGVFIDRAIRLVSRLVPSPSKKQQKQAIIRAMKECLAKGITSFHDAGVTAKTIKLYKELLRDKKLFVRMYVMALGSNDAFRKSLFAEGPQIGLGHHHLTIRGIKLLADGALGSRGAALMEPYADQKKHRGLVILNQRRLTQITSQALRAGFQVAVHAIGDRANHIVLNAFETAQKQHPWIKQPRLRIEHAQILLGTDIPRFAKLGVLASMQPTHCTSDMPWVHKRIGATRAKTGAYVWQSLLMSGARIIAGSDVPVESVNPFWGIYAAITRQSASGLPKKGWYPAQRMTRRQALRAYTLDAAYGAFEEKQKGSIAPGKLADLIVIDRNILTVPARQVRETKVLLTMVGGVIRHQVAQTTSKPTKK